MRIRNFRPVFKCLGCSNVVVLAKVLDEAQGEVKMPIVGIIADPFPDEFNGSCIVACSAGRRLIEKRRTPLVSNHQVRIKSGGDVQ